MIKENQRLLNQLNILSDGLIIGSCLLLAYFIRFHVLNGIDSVGLSHYLILAPLLATVQMAIYAIMGLYTSFRHKGLIRELAPLIQCNALVLAAVLVGMFLLKFINLSRMAMGLFFLLECAGLGAKRLLLRRILKHYRQKGFNQKHVILVGSGAMSQKYVEEVRLHRELGYQVRGYVAARDRWRGLDYLGDYTHLTEILEREKPDEVVVTLDVEEYQNITGIISACEKTGTKLSIIPYYAQYLPAQPQFDSLNGIPLINFRRIPLDNLGNAFLKRLMDIAGALVLIVVTSPVMLLAAIGIKLSSPGPIIFRQQRIGQNKREFDMYKFRSMRVNEESDVTWSTDSDPRKTKFGALLRKFSLDELPQFFNVLKGDMSLVGPRPEVPHFVAQFKEEIPLYMVKHQVRPGITGWAQVCGLRGDTSIEERIRHDIYYIEHWNILFDLKILFLTLFKGFVNRESLK